MADAWAAEKLCPNYWVEAATCYYEVGVEGSMSVLFRVKMGN